MTIPDISRNTMAAILLSILAITDLRGQKGHLWKKISTDIPACADTSVINKSKFINNELYVLSSAYGKEQTVYLHKWNGQILVTYPPIKILHHESIDDIEIFNGQVYLCGEFWSVNGIKRKKTSLAIIKFDGKKWDSLPSYPAIDSLSACTSMEVYKGKLYYITRYRRNLPNGVLNHVPGLYCLSSNGKTTPVMNSSQSRDFIEHLGIMDDKLLIAGYFDTLSTGLISKSIIFYDGSAFKAAKDTSNRRVRGLFKRNELQMIIVTDKDIELWEGDSIREIIPNPGFPVWYYPYIEFTFYKNLIICTNPYNKNYYYDMDSAKWFANNELQKFTRIKGVCAGPDKAIIIGCGPFSGAAELTSAGVIEGKLYLDKDSSCTFNPGDVVLKNTLIKISSKNDFWHSVTDKKGNYYFSTDSGYYMITPVNSDEQKISLNCVQDSVKVPAGTILQMDVPVWVAPAKNLSVKILAARGFNTRQGFTENYDLSFVNLGIKPDSCIISLKYPSNVTFVSSDIVPLVNNAGELQFGSYGLEFNEKRVIRLSFKTSVSTSKLGDQIEFSALVLNSEKDAYPDNNKDTLRQKIVGSYDPNIKQSFPQGRVKPGLKKLKYVICFQNTGNDTAYKVIIIDTFMNKLDLQSLKVTGSSHPEIFALRAEGRHTLIFEFDNILLPDSHTNEKASHGYVAFEAELRDTLTLGDSISNKAFIYFDYQYPIITNTALVVGSMTVDNRVTLIPASQKIIAYPNPASRSVTILSEKQYAGNMINLYNSMGHLVSMCKINTGGEAILDISTLPPGIYFANIKGTVFSTSLIVNH